MAIDPVCMTIVNDAKATERCEFKEKTYYFCCNGCKELFEKDPAKYLGKKLDVIKRLR